MSRAVKSAIAARRSASDAPDKNSHAGDDAESRAQKPLPEALLAACATGMYITLTSGRLNLSNRSPPLTECPSELLDLLQDDPPAWYVPTEGDSASWSARSQLHILLLGSNQMQQVSEHLAEFRDLARLELQGNQLTTLPLTLARLQNLTSLNLTNNKLQHVPSCITGMHSLVHLDLSHNMLESLWTASDVKQGHQTATDASSPAPLDSHAHKDLLPNLKTLDLSHNSLHTAALATTWPASLVQLDLSYNLLQEPISTAVWSRLASLEDLSLTKNQLGDTMFVLDAQDQVFPKLSTLDIRGTQATALGALESAFGSAPSVSLSEARDRQRSPPTPAAPAGACVPHQLVRVAAKPAPHDATEVRSALQQSCALPALFVLSDIQVRSESHRRRRGGRGRGGEDRNRSQNDREDEGSAPPNAGSALANAKLSTKKKEALGQVPCKFFRNNGCSAGDACPFAHTLPGEGQPKAVCQWFIKGSCRFGHRCALAHIMPGQPMSMDRKNKRAAQQSASQAAKGTEEQRGPSEKGDAQQSTRSAPVPAPTPHAAFQAARDSSDEPSAGLSALSPDSDTPSHPHPSTWGSDVTLRARTYEPPSTAAFGTSPFDQPGSHSLFFNAASADARPTRDISAVWGSDSIRSEDMGPEADHAEDFLPSSLTDLLTPAELERRARHARDPVPHNSSIVSQSLPSHAQTFGGFGTSPSVTQPGRMSYGGSMSLLGGMSAARRSSSSVQASPFMPPLLDNSLGSPTSISPPGTLSSSLGGERVTAPFSTRAGGDEVRRRAAPGSGAYHARGHPPISPAILPKFESDADETMFELE
ncbi:hypothetical protein MCAP1_002899 [Malassezia caprae]|uniref:C3H1-type domain-containing protein n=1 Tax=Malassezia caprae TaxID=1381934 RepID=A0AAF0J146_9BASI|nr:hypothetical protein MCAP1_002899 [Malassezia caprae]